MLQTANIRSKWSLSIIDEARRWLEDGSLETDLSFANVMDSMEHIQSDNELDSDFEEDEDEVEIEEVDEENKGQISASCCFCCTLSMVESLFYNLCRNVKFMYV